MRKPARASAQSSRAPSSRAEPTQAIRAFFAALQQLGAHDGARRNAGQSDKTGKRK